LDALSSTAKIVRARSRFRVIREDPEDNTILALAYDARSARAGGPSFWCTLDLFNIC